MMKLTKLTLTFVVAITSTTVFAQNSKKDEAKKEKWSEAFNSDSEFMKGFETGIFMRTKGGKVEEYGCAPANDSDSAGA